jgi:hypothetical protein
MWIMSIYLLFLSAPQVFPKFILILIPVKTGVANQTVWFWSPDIFGLYTGFQQVFSDLSDNLPGHVWSLSKKSQVGSKSSFLVYLFYPSWSMWSCEDFAMLKRERGYGGGSFYHVLSLYVILSQVIANCWKRGSVEINFYMGINDEKGKSLEDYIELMILYLIWVLRALYY